MTDVIVHHLGTEQKRRIRCKDYIKKIALWKDKLAVMLPDRVVVYALSSEDTSDMNYKMHAKIGRKMDCQHFGVVDSHIISGLDRKIQLINFNGEIEKEWLTDSDITFCRVIGGTPTKEYFVAGLANGHVLKIFVDNPFPVTLIVTDTPVKALDISACKKKIAIVDAHEQMNI